MPLPRLLCLWLAPLAAAVVAVPVLAQRGEAAPPVPAEWLVASGERAAAAGRADGSWRTELPWLAAGDGDVAVSPDGNRVAFSSARTGNREIWVGDARTGTLQRLTSSTRSDDRWPAWSPDGRRIAWTSTRSAGGDVLVMRADGGGKRLLVGGPGDDVDPAWAPDGRSLAFASDRGGRYGIWVVAAAAGAEPELVAQLDGDARAPAWRRDGRQLAFSGSVGRRTSIWTLSLDTLAPRRVTSSSARDLRPDWAPRGNRIAFTRVAPTGRRTWTVVPGAPARPVPGSEGDSDPDWSLASADLAPGPEQQLPDLDQRAPADLRIVALDGAFRLGFTSAVENVGRGPLRIRGRRAPGAATMRADQLVELADGRATALVGVGSLRYEAHPPHRHWHFQEFETYELRTADGRRIVGRDRKSGFCLIDRYGRASARVPDVGLPRFVSDCGAGQRQLRRVEQGSSPGYVDRYPAFFHGQDIELTGLAAGTYVLVHRANPTLRLREQAYSNDAASVRIRLTWPGGPTAPPRVAVLRRCYADAHCPPG